MQNEWKKSLLSDYKEEQIRVIELESTIIYF